MAKLHDILLEAYSRGYRVDSKGNVVSPFSGKYRKCRYNSGGYKCFNIKIDLKAETVYTHHLQAYQKFGERVFDPRLEVRHLDGDSGNNSYDNVAIGTRSDNCMDKSPEVRLRASLSGSRVRRKLDEKTLQSLLLDRKEGFTYKQLCNKYNLAKSTVSYIGNGKTYKHI